MDDLGTIGFKTRIPGFNYRNKTGDVWLDGRKKVDGAENYWRVHDGLYDLSGFVKIHPGGAQWLELTQGTDITEAFECHHIQETASHLLKKFYIKPASTPRISPYTFKDDGFYRTLKARLRPVLKSKSQQRTIRLSAIYTDLLFLFTVTFAILSTKYWNFWLGAASGVSLGCLTIASHNYFHQKDNWRMYYFQLSLMSVREWRVSHALSHHLFPNTIIDMEMIFLEPLAYFYPIKKTFVAKYLPWVVSPFVWCIVFHGTVLSRLLHVVKTNDTRTIRRADLISLTLPALMYLCTNQCLTSAILMWNFVLVCASFHFSIVGINAAHHHPRIFHDGDAPREEKDFGFAQLDAVMDRNEITGSHFLVLTNFGDHALHHLFPTVDQGILNDAYPVFKETAKEFGVDVRMTSQWELVKGQFLQIARSEPNPNPPK